MLNIWIAVLVEKGVLDEEEGKLLVEKLRVSTLPGDYASARQLAKKLFALIEHERD